MIRLGLTARAVENPRLDGRGVAARIFWPEGLIGEFAHCACKMTRGSGKVKPPLPVKGPALTSHRNSPSW